MTTVVMATRCVRRSLRDPGAFCTTLLLPVILMLMFVYVFGGAMSGGHGQYVDYVVPGLIVLCAGFGAATTAVAVASDMSSGIMDRFASMPVRPGAVLAGHVAASMARNLLATALVIGVAFTVGWHPVAGPAAWAGAIAAIIGFILAMSWLAAAAGIIVGSPEAANSVTFAIMFAPYLSTAFVPVASMTRGLRPVAANQPFTPVIETMRGLWAGRTSTGAATAHEAVLAVAWFAVIGLVAAVSASYLFRHRGAA